MLADVADASRPVRPENKGKYLTYEIGIYLARPYFLGAFGARMVTLPLTQDLILHHVAFSFS